MLVRAVAAVTLMFSLLIGSDLRAQDPATQADLNRLRSEIQLLKQDIEIKEAELRVMELQIARQSTASSPPPKPVPKPANTAKPATMAPPPPSPAVAVAAPLSVAPKRANVDPRPYEAAVVGHLNFFRATQGSKWLALDEKRLVYWVLDDEAYMLTMAQNCAGLLSAERLRLQSFSNKVRAGHDGIVFDDQLCLIESIAKLGGKSLPKPPRK